MENTQAEVEAMPNGKELLSIYSENDIETYQDVLYFVGQVSGRLFCINRRGKLEFRKYGMEPVAEVQSRHRFSSSFSDFITRIRHAYHPERECGVEAGNAGDCGGSRQEGVPEGFPNSEYLHLETYDKQVMATLIASAKVMGEDRLEATWKYGDVYE